MQLDGKSMKNMTTFMKIVTNDICNLGGIYNREVWTNNHVISV